MQKEQYKTREIQSFLGLMWLIYPNHRVEIRERQICFDGDAVMSYDDYIDKMIQLKEVCMFGIDAETEVTCELLDVIEKKTGAKRSDTIDERMKEIHEKFVLEDLYDGS